MTHTFESNKRIPRIGMRIIKSAIGIFICFLIDMLRGGSGIVFYSQLAVLWCIRDYVSETKKFALQRTVGTVIGAVYGLIVLIATRGLAQKNVVFAEGVTSGIGSFIAPIIGFLNGSIGYGLIVSIFIILVLYTTVILKQKQASYFSCVVFLSIVINHLGDANPYMFVWNRFLDTMIGILVGVAVNCIDFHRKINKNTLFLSGLDDTLLASKGTISDYSRVELNRMIESGVNFTVSTIRTPASLLEPLRGINLSLPVISMDGAALFNIAENSYEKVYIIASEHSSLVRDYLQQRNVSFFTNVVIEDVLLIYYMDSENESYNELIRKMRKSPYRNYIKRDVPMDEDVVYFTIIDKTEIILELYHEMVKEAIFDSLKVVYCPDADIEGCSLIKIYNKNASKENMLDYLKEKLGIEKTVTFGTIEGKYSHVIKSGDFNRVVKLMKKELNKCEGSDHSDFT